MKILKQLLCYIIFGHKMKVVNIYSFHELLTIQLVCEKCDCKKRNEYELNAELENKRIFIEKKY